MMPQVCLMKQKRHTDVYFVAPKYTQKTCYYYYLDKENI